MIFLNFFIIKVDNKQLFLVKKISLVFRKKNIFLLFLMKYAF